MCANVEADGVRKVDGTERVSFELALDLRRLRPLRTLLMRLVVVFDPEDLSVSLLLDELEVSEELEDPSISARTPG